MSFLFFLGAIGAAIYGVLEGSGLALIIATISMAAGVRRLDSKAAAQDIIIIRQFGGRLFDRPWKLSAWVTLLTSIIAALWIRESDPHLLSFGLWLVSLAAVIGTGVLYDRGSRFWQRLNAVVKWQRLDWLIMLGLLAAALAIRVYALDPYLPAMHGDEGEMGMLARLALYGPGEGRGSLPLHLFRTAFLDHPNLFHYLQAGALLLFGDSEVSLKLLSAIFGALCAPLIYAAGRLGWGRTAGLMGGWLLAVSHFHIHYSRIALNNIQSVWFASLFALLVVMASVMDELPNQAGRFRFFRKGTAPTADLSPALEASEAADASSRPLPMAVDGRLTLFIVIGLVVGLSQYFYYGSRLIALLAIPVLLLLWRAKRATLGHVLAAGMASIVAFLPLLLFYAANMYSFLNRMGGVSVFKPEGLQHTLGPTATWPEDIPRLLLYQIDRNFDFFIRSGDFSAFYTASYPAFDFITVVLFWLGLGVLLIQWRHLPAQVMLLWFFMGIFFGGILTNDAPNGPRLVILAPVVCLIAGLNMQIFHDFLKSLWPPGQIRVAFAAGIVLAIITLQVNYTNYFERFSRYQIFVPLTEIGYLIKENAESHDVLLLGAPNLFVEHGTIRFITNGVKSYNLFSLSEFPDRYQNAAAADKDLLLIVMPFRSDDLAQIQVEFPEGSLQEHHDRMDRLTYFTYTLPIPSP